MTEIIVSISDRVPGTEVLKMAEKMETKNIGLRGITVADTKISFVDGERGRLYYRGYTIEQLAAKSNFEETAYLLIYGKLPTKRELEKFSAALAAERGISDKLVHAMMDRPATAAPMDVLQSAVPMLADYDPGLRDDSREANYRRAVSLIAKMPTLIAAWRRVRDKKPPVKPDPELTHAANFLYMLTGKKPAAKTAKELDTCLVLHADHTFNASTFAAREVASTRAHIFAAVSAAIGALSGDLHGGANARVMEMLLEIKDPRKAEAWVKKELARKERIFGMGHAVYRTYDPRERILGPMSARLGKLAGDTRWHDLSMRIMETTMREMKKTKGMDIYPNVDFFSASVYYMLGIPIALFPPVFAISRVAGWCAHVIEEKFAEAQPRPMLYRPQADYIGQFCAPEGCPYVPIGKRGS